MTPPTMFTGMPHIPLPLFASVGFEDTSWHNDLAASLELDLGKHYALHCWVCEPDVKDREDPTFNRFNVAVYRKDPLDGSIDTSNTPVKVLYEGEDELQATVAIATFLRNPLVTLLADPDQVVRDAEQALWETITEAYPTADSGDLDPTTSLMLTEAIRTAVWRWGMANVPSFAAAFTVRHLQQEPR